MHKKYLYLLEGKLGYGDIFTVVIIIKQLNPPTELIGIY